LGFLPVCHSIGLPPNVRRNGQAKSKKQHGAERDIRDLQATTTHTEKRMNQPNKQEKGKKKPKGPNDDDVTDI
jgi:hypothetical protein